MLRKCLTDMIHQPFAVSVDKSLGSTLMDKSQACKKTTEGCDATIIDPHISLTSCYIITITSD